MIVVVVSGGANISRQSLWGERGLVGATAVPHPSRPSQRGCSNHWHHQPWLVRCGAVTAGAWRLQLGSVLPLGSRPSVHATGQTQLHFTHQVSKYVYTCNVSDVNETNLFHHSLLAPTWTAFSDYTGPDLLCSTVFRFLLFFYFGSCGRLSWLNCQLSSAR